MFADIHAGGQRMLTLVNGLLDVSQMDSAVGSLPLRRTDVASLVRDAVGQLHEKTLARGLRVRLVGVDQPVSGDVDQPRFQQAVVNVLANSIRFSATGGEIEVVLKSDAGLRQSR